MTANSTASPRNPGGRPVRDSSTPGSGAAATGRSDLSVIAFLAFLGILMAFGIDAALPAFDEIGDDLDVASGALPIQLIGTTYLLGMAVGQLIYGPVSDKFGRIPVLRVGLTLYAIGGLAAALSPEYGVLLGARFVWGFGAASPGVLRGAIARDLYSGDEMARIVTLMMAVFMIGPMIVPFFGQAILLVGPWPWIFAGSGALAIVAIAWTGVFGETLPPERRRDLSVKPLIEAAKAVVRTRVTIGHIVAQTLSGAAFFIFLGSSAVVITDIYGEGDRFALWFALSGVVSVVGLVINNKLLGRYGTSRMIVVVSTIYVAMAVAGLVVALSTDGRPPFVLWLVLLYGANAAATLITPMANALAMEPMGDQAGMASAILGFVTMAGGSLLAAVFDARIETSVTPMQIGFVLYGGLALVFILLARPARSSVDAS